MSSELAEKPHYPADCFWYDSERGRCAYQDLKGRDPREVARICLANEIAASDIKSCSCLVKARQKSSSRYAKPSKTAAHRTAPRGKDGVTTLVQKPRRRAGS